MILLVEINFDKLKSFVINDSHHTFGILIVYKFYIIGILKIYLWLELMY